jgi:carbon-monoxide dehydrogenase small subunit
MAHGGPESPDRRLADGSLVALHVRVNGEDRSLEVPADRLLVDVLRSDLGLTGTKDGCGIGVCGACSVIVDGRLLSSCIVLAASLDGATIRTVEGLSGPDGSLSALQEAFIGCGGFQCGICTPGQLVAATALLDRDPSPAEADVREWLTGNLCRCTGYGGVVDAVLQAAAVGRADRPSPTATR